MRALAGTVALVLPLSACGLFGDDDASPSGSATPSVAPGEQVSISMAVWGGFGLEDLVAEYETLHPEVTIDLQTGDYNPLHTELLQELTAGAGAPTIAAIGEDYMSTFAARSEDFVDLSTLGASDLESRYLAWKWAQGTAADGAVIGVGGDVGGLALCYRSDLLAAAGLPSDRDTVAKTIGDSWSGLETFGKQYAQATKGKAFLDSASSILAPLRQQGGYSYYAADGSVDIAPAKESFDTAVSFVDSGLSAGLVQFSDEWTAGLDSGAFAATLCPLWMMGYIEGQLIQGESAAKWDVTALPGAGGSWGGTFYSVPAQGSADQQKAAWDFLSWLLEPAQQLRVFVTTGSLPSQPELYTEAAVTDYSNSFFNDAPVGRIMAESVSGIPVPKGYAVGDATIEATLQAVIAEVESGNATAADAWSVAEQAATQAAANSGGATASATPAP